MSHPAQIDGFEFAAAGARQQGSWPVRELPRLRDMLASDEGEVAYVLEGARDGRGRPSLRLQVHGTLLLRCQRCLETMPYEVDAETLLVLAATQAEIDAEPPDAQAADRIVAGAAMPVRDLVEDELILAVPYAPRHEACVAQGAADAKPQDGKISPFAGLRGLMRGKH
jgi:uncharacterized protein